MDFKLKLVPLVFESIVIDGDAEEDGGLDLLGDGDVQA